jgi:hypothetical protein
MNLDFLASATLEDVAESKAVVRTGGQKKVRNPQGLAIRVFRTGEVYPSQELVDKFALEYAGKDAEHGYGFDVIDTDLFPSFKVAQRVILISPVKKAAGKVDLFGVTSYDKETGAPLASVMNQGAKTYGKDDLIPMIEEIYGIKFGTEEGQVEFLDLQLIANPATGEPWTTPREIAFIPKAISRGPNKGSVNTVRREKPQLYVLAPVSSTESNDSENAQSSDDQSAVNEANEILHSSEVAAEAATV